MNSIFTPFTVGPVTFANRIVMPPMATEKSAKDGAISAESVAYYAEMARSGMGLLIVEHNFITSQGKMSPRQMSIARDEDTAGHKRIAAAVHASGVPVAVQINHGGSNRHATLADAAIGASSVPHPSSRITPSEMSLTDINGLVTAFGAAARRALAAGYDAVEIHCAHGFLLSQFLSPLTNIRHDNYGGSALNRRRLLLEIVEEIKPIKGKMLLLVRLGISDNPPGHVLYPGGLEIAEGIAVAQALADAGIDILDLSGGMCGSRPGVVNGEAYYLQFATALRKKVNSPVIYTGGVTKPETAAAIVNSAAAELVGVGRALAADPEWIAHAKQNLI